MSAYSNSKLKIKKKKNSTSRNKQKNKTNYTVRNTVKNRGQNFAVCHFQWSIYNLSDFVPWPGATMMQEADWLNIFCEFDWSIWNATDPTIIRCSNSFPRLKWCVDPRFCVIICALIWLIKPTVDWEWSKRLVLGMSFKRLMFQKVVLFVFAFFAVEINVRSFMWSFN